MEVQRVCFNDFPDKCSGCPEYREYRQDPYAQFILTAGIGLILPPPYTAVVKECKVYNKRIVEYKR